MQVLFLDEPTAGLDPYSRHKVWALLNERKAGRVTLFTTQFMDEADILAGEFYTAKLFKRVNMKRRGVKKDIV